MTPMTVEFMVMRQTGKPKNQVQKIANLLGGWALPLWKNDGVKVSWMLGSLLPTEWKNNNMFQTTNQQFHREHDDTLMDLGLTFGWIWALNWKNAPHLGCGSCHEGTSWKVYFPDLDVIRCNILSTRLKVVHGWIFCYNGSVLKSVFFCILSAVLGS